MKEVINLIGENILGWLSIFVLAAILEDTDRIEPILVSTIVWGLIFTGISLVTF